MLRSLQEDQSRLESKDKFFSDEKAIKDYVDGSKGVLSVHSDAITNLDASFLKHGELRIDSKSGRLVIKINDKLYYVNLTEL